MEAMTSTLSRLNTYRCLFLGFVKKKGVQWTISINNNQYLKTTLNKRSSRAHYDD